MLPKCVEMVFDSTYLPGPEYSKVHLAVLRTEYRAESKSTFTTLTKRYIEHLDS